MDARPNRKESQQWPSEFFRRSQHTWPNDRGLIGSKECLENVQPLFAVQSRAMSSSAVYATCAREIPTDDWQKLYTSTLGLEYELSKSLKSIGTVDLILTGIVSPAFNSIAVGLINDSQLHRQARVAIAIRLYSHRHSELPSRLDQLPEYAVGVLNPFGDRPFGYTVTNRQSVLWGFYLSKDQRQTPSTLPVTDQPNEESSRNRESVWWFD